MDMYRPTKPREAEGGIARDKSRAKVGLPKFEIYLTICAELIKP